MEKSLKNNGFESNNYSNFVFVKLLKNKNSNINNSD